VAIDASNDDDSSHPDQPRPEPDAYGQAAMLLVESLIHGLIARSILSTADAVEIVDAAAEVCFEMATELGKLQDNSRALAILDAISASLNIDITNN